MEEELKKNKAEFEKKVFTIHGQWVNETDFQDFSTKGKNKNEIMQ